LRKNKKGRKMAGSIMDLLSQQLMEAQFHELSWQEQARSLNLIKQTQIWKKWKRPDSDEPYESFAEYVVNGLHMTHQTAYKRVKMGEDPRFNAFIDVEVSIGLVTTVLEMDVLSIFETVVLLIKLGVGEKEIEKILKNSPSEETILELAEKRRDEVKSLVKQLNKCIKSLKGKMP
jgi:chromosome segregation and condensation protein ScpB